MTVQVQPNSGRAGRLIIQEQNTNTAGRGHAFANFHMQHYLVGDLCLPMCPGVRMVKGYVQGRVGITNKRKSSGMEIRLDFQGWADVRESDSARDLCLHGFEVAIDFTIKMPNKRPLKLSAAARFKYRKDGKFVVPDFKTFEAVFTNRAKQLSPSQAKNASEFCHNLATNVQFIIRRYSQELHDLLANDHLKKYEWDAKTGRVRRLKARPDWRKAAVTR